MLSRKYSAYYHTMPDGTVKQTNPFSGIEVWSIPGRGKKPLLNGRPAETRPVMGQTHHPSCIFCPDQRLRIAPEKSRTALVDGRFETLYYLLPGQQADTVPEFRRVGNMFEIVTAAYWATNYGYRMPQTAEQWRDAYLADPAGADHIDAIVRYKCAQSDPCGDAVEVRDTVADGFFGGCHDLIIGPRHYAERAEDDSQICSSGELTPDEHFRYFAFTVDAMRDMLEMNAYIRYITVFQNWLHGAGASVDHLHKQVCALDEWGAAVTGKVETVLRDPNAFNELGVNLASQHNLVLARNDHAVAFVGIGHRYPTIEIHSAAPSPRPFQHGREELRGFSDLVHACHAALGGRRACNEEWFYTPVDAVYPMPWHIELKWRVNVQAGFEGGTGIHINPVLPTDFRDTIMERLSDLQSAGAIGDVTLVDGCMTGPNPLRYAQR